MKVLFFYRVLSLGGVEASVLRRIRVLRGWGIDAHYWFSKFHCQGAQYITNHDFVQQVDVLAPTFLDRLAQFDIVVVIDFPDLVVRMEKARVKTPVLFESHAAFPPALEKYYSVLKSQVIKGIIVPSEYNRQLIVSSQTANLEPIVIPNCVDFSVGPFLGGASAQMDSNPTVLWVGRMGDNKNPIEAIRIAQVLEDVRPEIEFLMVGDSPKYDEYMEALKAQAGGEFPRTMRFQRRVAFEDMKELYSSVAREGGLLLSTSKFESVPMTFIEAMACNCPILSAEVGGISTLLDSGRFGWMYTLGEVPRAAGLVDRLTQSSFKHTRDELVKSAHEYVSNQHAPARITAQYLEVLERFSSGGSKPWLEWLSNLWRKP